jgi:hypothetical protein
MNWQLFRNWLKLGGTTLKPKSSLYCTLYLSADFFLIVVAALSTGALPEGGPVPKVLAAVAKTFQVISTGREDEQDRNTRTELA